MWFWSFTVCFLFLQRLLDSKRSLTLLSRPTELSVLPVRLLTVWYSSSETGQRQACCVFGCSERLLAGNTIWKLPARQRLAALRRGDTRGLTAVERRVSEMRTDSEKPESHLDKVGALFISPNYSSFESRTTSLQSLLLLSTKQQPVLFLWEWDIASKLVSEELWSHYTANMSAGSSHWSLLLILLGCVI